MARRHTPNVTRRNDQLSPTVLGSRPPARIGHLVQAGEPPQQLPGFRAAEGCSAQSHKLGAASKDKQGYRWELNGVDSKSVH